MDLLDRLAEANIASAAERGELDNLPGAGQPLDLDDDQGVPAELRAGYRLLKNAGFVPPELETRRELDSIDKLLAAATDDSSDTEHLARRRRWLELRLAESSRGRALLRDPAYGERLRDRLADTDQSQT
ncbi:DUF1992 domain-containing protein [Salinisphaera sp. USBA-960]|uniref:DnaJ family domain-containing protein n=1 Tax=Salinisphaera orenii TaxID=856731 RepID=UPI000DBE6349|nr:DUF1992 domain-containing protein [Salifodinibacter halophilus]NNC26718.1 DUF1992 domain-containing protein [Salifodinibacter halophilus]